MPVLPGTEGLWREPPFGGVVANGVIWGRGALDDKSAVIAQLEAATHLLRAGFQPARTVYFSFGHDEEVGGTGAAAVTETLRAQGVRRIAILGDMLELGEDASFHHARLAGPLGRAADLAFLCGPDMTALQAALPADLPCRHAVDSAALSPLVTEALRPGDLVLVKGSLGSKMRLIVEAIEGLAGKEEPRNAAGGAGAL